MVTYGSQSGAGLGAFYSKDPRAPTIIRHLSGDG